MTAWEDAKLTDFEEEQATNESDKPLVKKARETLEFVQGRMAVVREFFPGSLEQPRDQEIFDTAVDTELSLERLRDVLG